MSIRKLTLTGFIALASLGSGLLLTCAPATAAVGHKLIGQLNVAGGALAIDSSGNVYVTVTGPHGVVYKYNSLGEPVPGSGGSGTPFIAGTPNGPFTELTNGIGVGPEGDIYVIDGGHEGNPVQVVYKFNAAGELIPGPEGPGSPFITGTPRGPFQILPSNPVVDSEGDVYIADEQDRVVDKFTSAGVFVPGLGGPESPFITTGRNEILTGLAIDSSGNIYVAADVARGIATVVEKFNALGEFVSGAGGPGSPFVAAGTGDLGQVAIDPTGDIFLAQRSTVVEFDPAGSPLPAGTLGGFSLFPPSGVAVSPAGDVYVADDGKGVVDIYGPLFLPDVVTGGTSNRTSGSVTLNGTINPEGELDAQFFFQYGPDTKYTTASTVASDAGSVTLGSPLEVSVPVSFAGLPPHTIYHYRLVGSTEANGDNFGGDETFVTPSIAPSMTGQPSVSLLTRASATVNASINPNNEPTSYRIEYGTTTAYGSSTSLPEASAGQGYGNVIVHNQLVGLSAGTTYHYRLIATNSTGSVTSQDQTFTTAAATPPGLSSSSASLINSSEVVLSGTIDPGGIQTSYEFDIGNDTNYETRIFGDAGAANGPETVTAVLQGLASGAIYHYRIVAVNLYGRTYGPDEVFTTPTVSGSALSAPLAQPLIAMPVASFPGSKTATSRKKKTTGKEKKTKKKIKKRRQAKRAQRDVHRHATHGRNK